MTTVAYTSTEIAGVAGTFTGGLGGAPTLIRSSQKDKVTAIAFHFTQGGTQGNINDTVDLAYVTPTTYVYGGILIFSAGGSSNTSQVGLVDKNNSSNSNATLFMAATSTASAGSLPIQNTTLPVQAGTDPAGDETTGNAPPGYGVLNNTIQLKFAGAGFAASATMNGYLLVSAGN